VEFQKAAMLPVIILLFCSCLPCYYPGITGAHAPGIVSLPPAECNMPVKAIYLSLDGGTVMPFNSGERNTPFRGRFFTVRSGKRHTVNYGFFAYGGSYTVENVARYKGKYSYYGPGFEFSGEIHQPAGRVDVGIGTYWSGVFEFGDFRTFRKRSEHDHLAENNTSSAGINISVFPLIRWRATDQASINIQCALGLPGLISPVIALQHRDMFFWTCWLPGSLDDPDRDRDFFSIGIGRKIQ